VWSSDVVVVVVVGPMLAGGGVLSVTWSTVLKHRRRSVCGSVYAVFLFVRIPSPITVCGRVLVVVVVGRSLAAGGVSQSRR